MCILLVTRISLQLHMFTFLLWCIKRWLCKTYSLILNFAFTITCTVDEHYVKYIHTLIFNSLFCEFLCSLVLIWRRPPCLVVKMFPWDWLEGERIKMVPKDQDHLLDHRQGHLPIVHLTYRGWLVPSPTNQSKVCYSRTTISCTVSPFMSWNWSLILFLCPLSFTWVTCTVQGYLY